MLCSFVLFLFLFGHVKRRHVFFILWCRYKQTIQPFLTLPSTTTISDSLTRVVADAAQNGVDDHSVPLGPVLQSLVHRAHHVPRRVVALCLRSVRAHLLWVAQELRRVAQLRVVDAMLGSVFAKLQSDAVHPFVITSARHTILISIRHSMERRFM